MPEVALPDISDLRVLDVREIPLYDPSNENDRDQTRENIMRQLLEGHLTTDLPAHHVPPERFRAHSANDNSLQDQIANEIVKIDNDSLQQYIDITPPLIPFDDETKNQSNYEITVIDELVELIDKSILTATTPAAKYQTPVPQDFTSVYDHPEPFKLHWGNNKVSVELERVHTNTSNKYGEIVLRFSWKTDNIEIELNTYTNTNVQQTWKFGDVNALLGRDEIGTKNQYWNIAPNTYYYYEGKQDGTYVSLTTPRAKQAVQHYENEINSFCKENYRFFPTQDCIVYYKNPINFTSDEISTNHSTNQIPPRKFQPPQIDDFYIITADETNALEMIWQGKRGTIHQQREENDTWRLDWNIDDIVVNLIKTPDRQVQQFWHFDNAVIQLVHYPNGTIHQLWDIDGQKFEYYQDGDHCEKKIGHIEPDNLTKYEQEMKLWCKENEAFFPTAFCIIYTPPSV